jgi:hypothetical protein
MQGVAKPGAICLSEQTNWQVKGRLDFKVTDLGATQLKNFAEPVRVYSLDVGQRSLRLPGRNCRRWPAVVFELANSAPSWKLSLSRPRRASLACS